MPRHLLHAAAVFLVLCAVCALPALAGPPAAAGGPVVNVRAFGAAGDGSHDDSAAVQRAIAWAAGRRGTVLVPRGVYLCASPIRLADDVDLRGAGASASWLQGRLEFGSLSKVSGLKIGRTGACALTNRPGANRTSIIRCRLHGGGSQEGVNSPVLYLGGPQGSVSRIVFTRCQIERTSYVPRAGVDAYARNVGNTVTIHEFCHLRHSGHVERIAFRRCHLGAWNGHAKGALRMMLEAYTWDGGTGRVYHGWEHLTLENCLIEASDTAGLDFADKIARTAGKHSSSGVLVEHCRFLGARTNDTFGHGGLPIVYECPTHIVIRDNKFYASPAEAIGGSHVGSATGAPGLLIENNIFDMTRSPAGLTHLRGEPCISLVGSGSRVVGNRFVYRSGLGVLIKGGSRDDTFAAVGNVVQGNVFVDRRDSDGEQTVKLTDDSHMGCRGNSIAGNTILNHGAGSRGVIAQTSGSGTNYARRNRIRCGDAAAFVVRSGRIVQSGNVIE